MSKISDPRRFFCENCGKEVEEDEELCRHCGAVFVAIKCPQCGYRGKAHHFTRGCPVCGFLGEENPVRAGEYLLTDQPKRAGRDAPARKPLPEWFFWVVMGVLVLAFIVLSRVYLRV
jgi:predicted RNA-binding Zn-ribbon protein involved in translation (DUF1610 family)